jgi:biotin carboxyl carrier protein
MKLIAEVNGKTRPLELQELAPGGHSFSFVAAERAGEADVREVEPGVYSILLGGRSLEVKMDEGAHGYVVAVNGRRYEILVHDPRRLSRVDEGLQEAGPKVVVAPMPGKVIRLKVQAGDTVETGQGLVVVEAMKMQNELKSPKAGTVKALHVKEGSSVSAGEALLVVE